MPSRLERLTANQSSLTKIKNSLLGKLFIPISALGFALAGCGPEEKECVTHLNKESQVCIENTVFYRDTCGNTEVIKEHCYCGCNEAYTGCEPCPDYSPLKRFNNVKKAEDSKPEFEPVDYTREWQFQSSGECAGKPDGTS